MSRRAFDVDKHSPATAAVTIALDPRGKSLIHFVNVGATHLFQSTRHDLEKRLFSSLLPEPLAVQFECIMRKFARTGEEGLLVGSYEAFAFSGAQSNMPVLVSIRDCG